MGKGLYVAAHEVWKNRPSGVTTEGIPQGESEKKLRRIKLGGTGGESTLMER